MESFDASLAEINDGCVTTRRAGDAQILAHYTGQIGYVAVLSPVAVTSDFKFPAEAPDDGVDRLINNKLRRLNIAPAGPCNDYDFVRRVHLDVVGRLPTPTEVLERRKNQRKNSIDGRASRY